MKKVFSFLNKYKFIFISMLLGTVCFFLIYGFEILNPTNVEWILAKGGDITQHYLGWEFYRRSPWTFPIGINSISIYPFDISIIYTDSIPLFAVFFKLFNNILPYSFQYLGIYGLLCFMLQGLCSTIVLKKFIKNDYLASLLSVFFIISPIVIDRMFHHTALVSHYLIMLGFALVLYKDKFSLKKLTIYWGLLSFVSVFTHIYILLFNGIILLGYMLYEYLESKDLKRIFFPFLSFIIIGVLSIFILGGFSMPVIFTDINAPWLLNFNLNGFFNPYNFSKILPGLTLAPNTFPNEGFSYLGLGLILIFILSIFISIFIIIYKLVMKKKIKFNKNLLITIISISIIVLIAATAKEIYFGDKLILKYNLPNFLNSLLNMFRSNARIVWVLYYIIIYISIYVLYNVLNKKFFAVFMTLLLMLQIYDIQYLINLRGDSVHQEYNPIMVDKRWDLLFEEDYKKVILPTDFPENLDYMYNVDLYVLKYNKLINRFNTAQNVMDPIVEQEVLKSLENLNDEDLYIIDPYAYMKYKDYDMNYYIMDGIYIGTTRNLSYLDKVNTSNVVLESNETSVFQFKKDKNYVIEVKTQDYFVYDAIDPITLGGCKIELIDDIMYIHVSNISLLEVIVKNNVLVKFTVKEVENEIISSVS